MYVKIELFKTNFDEENVFVGTPSKTVDTVLDGFAASEKLVLPLSPFNLKYPFRLAIPYFSVARKYNYARYRFYSTQDETAPPADTRYYFVEDFIPIDDQSTEIRAREDILARVFYDLTYQSFLPDRMTYKNSKINRLFDVSEFNSTRFDNVAYANFNVEKVADLIAQNDVIEYRVVGGIIITATCEQRAQTVIGNTVYPVLTILLPFSFRDYNTVIFPSSNEGKPDTFDCTDYSGTQKTVLGINNLKSIFSYTGFGFKVISTNICYNLAGFVNTARTTDNRIDISSTDKIRFENASLDGLVGGIPFIRITDVYEIYTQLATQEFQNIDGSTVKTTKTLRTYIQNENIGKQFFQAPFYKISLTYNGSAKDINPLYIDYRNFDIEFVQSFVPPYISGLRWGRGTYDNYYFGTEQTDIFAAIVSSGMSFLDFTDNYGEFLRTNYNSLVTGLSVNQESERRVFEIQQSAQGLKTLVNAGVTLASGSLGSATQFARSKYSAGGSITDTLIDTGASAWQLAINQEKERKLLDLRLQDMENMPDTVSISSDKDFIEKTRAGCIISIKRNAAIRTYRETIKRYGVSSPTRSETMVNHSVFDYVRCTDITFTQKTITLSEVERVAVEKYFRDGVRLWYDYSHYKDFNADNPEV